MKMVTCTHCQGRVFLPGDLPPLHEVPCSKCQHPVMMPAMLRQFELRSIIASGGMGTVFRAWDTMLEREVAVKLMKHEFAQDPKAVLNFVIEARACAQLNHTNIIHIYTFDEHEQDRYLVMELAAAGCLDAMIERQGRIAELDVLDVGIKLAGALATALKHGLLHLDIKPGNILFNSDGEPKLVDFGLSRKADADADLYAPIFGTPYYIAPERVRQEGDTFKSDLYSLAGTLYHALTGHVPFEAATVEEVVAAHISTALRPAHEVVPGITVGTSEALSRAMAKDPAQRHGSYDEFILALTAARSQLLVSQFAPQATVDAQTGEVVSDGGRKSWWRR